MVLSLGASNPDFMDIFVSCRRKSSPLDAMGAVCAHIGDIHVGELAQGAQHHIGTAHTDAFASVPERLDVHHVLNDITAAQVTAEQRCKHVDVGKGCLCRAALTEVVVDGRAEAAAVKLLKN